MTTDDGPSGGKPRAFLREDLLCGGVGALLALAVYLATLAPNVSFLDSGELIVAAQHFGVAHPPGYPLWTFLTWLFQLLPLGNAAWECNLFSALCAAAAAGTFGALVGASSRFCFPKVAPLLRRVAAITTATAAAWSISVWSQAVITEVYSLHLLLAALFLAALFRWCVLGMDLRGLAPVLLLLALGFANHHLVLVLVPLVPLAVLLFRRDRFLQAIVWLLLLAAWFLGAYAWLSGDAPTLQVAERFLIVALIGVIAFVLARRDQVQWSFPLRSAALITLGVLAYAYLPVASMTNPPMNWGYARDPDGFYYVVNRSQFHGPLSFQVQRVLGPLLGIGSPGTAEFAHQATAGQSGHFSFGNYRGFVAFLGSELARNFSPLGLLFMALSLGGLWKLAGRPRRWLVIVVAAFALVALLQPAIDGARADLSGWHQQMPYHGLSFCLAAMLLAYGLLSLAQARFLRGRAAAILVAALCVVAPAFALFSNWHRSGQRDNWLAWEFGREMFSGLPENSVVFVSSDHARFISTYMVFGESPQAGGRKKDPAFDRRDLFVVTPNQLSGPFYHRTLRDQYGPGRPDPAGPAGGLFSRTSLYPQETLDLPTDEDITAIVNPAQARAPDRDIAVMICNDMAHVIWRRNRDRLPFYVEVSVPMPWVYSHAVPAGMLLEVRPERQDGIAAELVAADSGFWERKLERLHSDPMLQNDENARSMLAGCRLGIAKLYHHHGMKAETRRACLEALAFSPAHPGALAALFQNLELDLEEDSKLALSAIRKATEVDPRNPLLRGTLKQLESRASPGVIHR